MDDLRPAVSQFDGVQIVELGDLHGVGENLGIGVEHAVDILPHRHRLGIEDMGRHGRGVVRAFAPQGRRRAVGRTAYEALPHEYPFRTPLDLGPQARRRSGQIDLGVLVALLGDQRPAHVDPPVRNPGIGKVFRNDGRRNQLAERHDAVVPQLGVLGVVVATGRHLLQLGEERFDALQPHGTVPQLLDDGRMVLAQRSDFGRHGLPVGLLHPGENPLQRIGRLAHGRDDDEQVALVAYDFQQVAHPVGIADRRSSELVDLHRALIF